MIIKQIILLIEIKSEGYPTRFLGFILKQRCIRGPGGLYKMETTNEPTPSASKPHFEIKKVSQLNLL